jgi:hypothetical protein
MARGQLNDNPLHSIPFQLEVGMFYFNSSILRIRSRMSVRCRAVLLALVGCLAASAARGQEPPRVEGAAPPGHDFLKHHLGGAYFVARGLKQDYDRLLDRVKSLKGDLDAERISGPEALRELRSLQTQLDKLRAEIEEKKVLVRPVKIHGQTETMLFDLGPERLLVITADRIRIEGWDGPQVKCVLEKTVLAADEKPVDEHLKGLKVVHRHGRARDIVGRTQAEVDADEQKFYASPDGKKMTEQGRKSRQAFVQQIADSFALYRDFQGKDIDILEIEGLTHEQGNRQILVGIKSPDGGATLGSDWQRHAALTVYVPKCRAVVLRGCLAGLDVTDLNASLILSRAGSQNRDYEGTFRIRSLVGNLTVENAPLDLIDSVDGNVKIVSTMELANTGTHHEGGLRTAYTPPPRVLTCRNIGGDFSAWFTRGDLKLSGISGQIDIQNEFGDSTLVADGQLADKAHRLLSQSGRVEVQLTSAALAQIPLLALTNCSMVRTNARQDVLESTSFSTSSISGLGSRDWHGVKSVRKPEQGPASFFAGVERLNAILTGGDRSSGLDLISRGGTVVVTVDE